VSTRPLRRWSAMACAMTTPPRLCPTRCTLSAPVLHKILSTSATSDRLEQLEAELAAAGTFMVKGVPGQPVAHPLLGEVRQTRALRAQMLLARITVTPPEEKPSAGVFALGVQQRTSGGLRPDGPAQDAARG